MSPTSFRINILFSRTNPHLLPAQVPLFYFVLRSTNSLPSILGIKPWAWHWAPPLALAFTWRQGLCKWPWRASNWRSSYKRYKSSIQQYLTYLRVLQSHYERHISDSGAAPCCCSTCQWHRTGAPSPGLSFRAARGSLCLWPPPSGREGTPGSQ